MAVVSNRFNGYNTKQRIVVTLICLTLSTTLVSSISLYVDSVSVDEWEEQIDIDYVSMMVSGIGVKDILDEIEEIPGVTNVSGLDSAHGMIARRNVIYGFETSGNLYTLTDEYLAKFPTIFTLHTGRWPQNESEIAIPENLAKQNFIGVGWEVNYSHGMNSPNDILTIVGTYDQSSGDIYSFYYYSSIGVVVESRLNEEFTTTRAYVDIDKTPLNPYDANGALLYLKGISEEIRKLYPGYPEETATSGYMVNDALSTGISFYIDWRNTARSAQITRASGIILIVLFMVVLAIQYNLSDRKNETSFLRARGATERRIEWLVIRELLALTTMSAISGIFFGALMSRLALASTGYLQFNQELLFTSPFLITQDTLLLVIGLVFGLPSIAYLGIKLVAVGKTRVAEGKGRLGKFSKAMTIIRWDLGILLISLALMFASYSLGAGIQRISIFAFILPFLPIPVYLALGSLVMKGIGRATEVFSKIASRPLGKIPASIGIRRISKSSKSAGLVIMVIVLAITLAWNNAIADSSIPETRENHAKFTIGGDIIFQLEDSRANLWTEFSDTLTSNPEVITTTTVSMKKLFLSAGYSGQVDFVIMRPDEYRFVGYDYVGNRLNESGLNDILIEMIENPTAAVLTKDLADQYQVSVGDSIRAFKSESDVDYFTFTIIAIVDALTHPLIPESVRISGDEMYSVGSRLIWINSLYASEKMDLIADTTNFLTVATHENCNATELVSSLFNSGWSDVVQVNGWATVEGEYDSYISATLYKMDRAVDSMLSIASLFIVIGVMMVYATESLRQRKRNVAILRILGTEKRMIARIQFAELLFIIILSLGLLVLYAPLFVMNSLVSSLGAHTSWSFYFPIPVFIQVPLLTIVVVLLFFLVCLLAIISIMALLSTRIELKEALTSSWTKGGPSVESEIL